MFSIDLEGGGTEPSRPVVTSHRKPSIMNAILLFQKEPGDFPTVESICAEVLALTGFECRAIELPADEEEDDSGLALGFQLEIPDLEEDEGEPVARVFTNHRLDRDENVQAFVDEILAEEPELAEIFDKVHTDVMILFEPEDAAEEAAYALAYSISKALGVGILIPPFEDEDEGTAWFETAEDFYDMLYAEGEDDDEEGELEEEEGEDDK